MTLVRYALRLTRRMIDDLFDEFGQLDPAPSIGQTILDGQRVVLVTLTEQMTKAALLGSQLIHEVAQGNLTEWIKSTEAWRSAGLRGQIAAAMYFYGNWLETFNYITIGKADQGDLKLGNFIVNVITRPKYYEGENYAIIDVQRFKQKPYPLYVACQCFGEDKIVVWGYARWDEVETWEKDSFAGRSPAYCKPLDELNPVEELKQLIQ